ncbi:MAG: pyruvate kinase [Phycisphaerales bacterium]|nr:pyruvate kinase [Phycisphaerales bacterium]
MTTLEPMQYTPTTRGTPRGAHMSPHPHSVSWIDAEPTRPPHAKIVATLGPASDSDEMLEKLIEAGVSIFRLNFSHGSLEEMDNRLAKVRRAIDNSGRCVGILGDLQGPKMRVGIVPDLDEDGGMIVNPGDDIMFRKDQREAEIIDGIPTFGASFDELYNDVLPGQRVLINDGMIRMLAVDQVPGESLRCRVTIGGRITSKKGINLPESELNMPAITEKDWACAKWAAENQLDYVALSFVRTAEEIRELKTRLEEWRPKADEEKYDGIDHSIPVVAKIEKPQAVKNLDDIIEATDAVMVARGDLGVEMDVAKVPVIQKYILSRCNMLGKPVIVATQMLETMIDSVTPTRAEASDVANAVLDGCDAVMLSGETAVGKHPRVVVETMQRIIRVTESRMDDLALNQATPTLKEYPFRSAALAKGVWYMAEELGAKAIAVWSEAGGMARYLSQNNFRVPIYAYTSSKIASRRMALYGGVTPIYTQPPDTGRLRDWTDMVEDLIRSEGITNDGDPVLLVAGKPLGALLAQSTVSILRMGDLSSGFRVSTDL